MLEIFLSMYLQANHLFSGTIPQRNQPKPHVFLFVSNFSISITVNGSLYISLSYFISLSIARLNIVEDTDTDIGGNDGDSSDLENIYEVNEDETHIQYARGFMLANLPFQYH